MRKFLISVLLAGAAATPAIAGPHNNDRQQEREDRQSAREDRQSAREDRQSARDDRQSAREDRQPAREQRVQVREQRSSNFNGQQYSRPPQADVRQGGYAGGAERFNARPDRRNSNRGDAAGANGYVAPGARMVTAPRGRDRTELRDQRVQQRELRQQDVRDRRELRQSAREVPNVMHNRNPLIVSTTPQRGTQPPLRAERRRSPEVHWNTSWRNNHRYDWHNHRRHHRSLFHLGLYFDPYGWGYQPFSIGWRLWPSYYSNRYWINDPWMYRLPYAPPGYVWVRYWNDAMLVDTWTGTVVDVIPGFFW